MRYLIVFLMMLVLALPSYGRGGGRGGGGHGGGGHVAGGRGGEGHGGGGHVAGGSGGGKHGGGGHGGFARGFRGDFVGHGARGFGRGFGRFGFGRFGRGFGFPFPYVYDYGYSGDFYGGEYYPSDYYPSDYNPSVSDYNSHPASSTFIGVDVEPTEFIPSTKPPLGCFTNRKDGNVEYRESGCYSATEIENFRK